VIEFQILEVTQFFIWQKRNDPMTIRNAITHLLLICTCLVWASSVDADNLSAGKTYSYSVLPTFSGGTFYLDDPHVQLAGVFDTGDLTDGVTFPAIAPTTGPANTIVGWGDPVTIATEIIFDLGHLSKVDGVVLGTHTWAPFANGAPNDVVLSFSETGTAAGDFGNPINAAFLASDVPANGHHDLGVPAGGVLGRYVKLSFDGGAVLTGNTPNKWMLDEVTINGSLVPEPSTFALIALGLLSLGLVGWRRRR